MCKIYYTTIGFQEQTLVLEETNKETENSQVIPKR